MCVVDDGQWLDRASALTLAFVARRLMAERIGIVFAAREPGDELRGLPEFELRGLRNGDARALLGSAIQFILDEQIRDRVVAETRGNPLALLELPRGLTATELAGGFGLLDAHSVTGRIEESFVRRLKRLSEPVRRLLLLAAAEPGGDPVLLWRAAERLGIGAAPSTEGSDGLLSIGRHVTFRHPLVRSAVYGRPPRSSDGRFTWRWPRQPIGRPIRTGGLGIWRPPPPDPTKRLPWSSRARRGGRRRAVGSRPPRLSSSARSRCPPIPTGEPNARSRPRRPA